MEKEIKFSFVTPKKSKAGKEYWQIDAEDGIKYTLHEKVIAEDLAKHSGDCCLVEVATSDDGKWHNIRGFIKQLDKKGEPVMSGDERLDNQTPEEATPKAEKIIPGEVSRVIQTKERANSWEVGKAGNRFKIYYETADELKVKVDELKEAGFIVAEE